MSTSDLMKSKERECELNIPISGHSFGFLRQQAGFSSLCTHQSPIMGENEARVRFYSVLRV